MKQKLLEELKIIRKKQKKRVTNMMVGSGEKIMMISSDRTTKII